MSQHNLTQHNFMELYKRELQEYNALNPAIEVTDQEMRCQYSSIILAPYAVLDDKNTAFDNTNPYDHLRMMVRHAVVKFLMRSHVFTSYFANIRKIDTTIYTPVAICGGIPNWYKGAWYKKLAPKWDFFNEYKEGRITAEEYTVRYKAEVLNNLWVGDVLDEIRALIPQGSTPVLICYEKVGDFCHRNLVSDWINALSVWDSCGELEL